MGYLDNTSITVDAILTKRGRELLSRNDGSFRITQFALGDDEIDYSLFNESHPNGTQYASEAIENMPLIEAIPNGANCMNSKLITLSRGAQAIPYIQTSYPATGGTASVSTMDIQEFSTIATSESVRGTVLSIVATTGNELFSSTILTRTTSVIIEGVTSGAIISIPLTVNKTTS